MVDPSVSYAPVANDQARLFESEDEVPTDYQPVAIFHAEGADNWTDQSDMLEKLREEARTGERWPAPCSAPEQTGSDVQSRSHGTS